MNKIAFCVGLMLLASSANAVSNPNLKPSFADLTWYSNRATVKQQMTSKGYTALGDSKVGDTFDSGYGGKILGIPALIRHQFNKSNQLVRTYITFQSTPGVSIYSNLISLKTNLTSKYGQALTVDTVDENYRSDMLLKYELDRNKEVVSVWEFSTYKYYIGLDISKAYANNDAYYVTLAYESPAWIQESIRRDQNSDL